MSSEKTPPGNGSQDLPFAKELWAACDGLRGSVESAEYKHLVLGLVFLKYISDSFERRRSILEVATRDETSDLHTEDEDERTEILEGCRHWRRRPRRWIAGARGRTLAREGSIPSGGAILSASATPGAGIGVAPVFPDFASGPPLAGRLLTGEAQASARSRSLRRPGVRTSSIGRRAELGMTWNLTPSRCSTASTAASRVRIVSATSSA